MKPKSIVGGSPLPLGILFWTVVFIAWFILNPLLGPGLTGFVRKPGMWRMMLLNLGWSSALALPMGVQVATMARNSHLGGSLALRFREALTWAGVATVLTFTIAAAVIPHANTRSRELQYELKGQPMPADRTRNDRELGIGEMWHRIQQTRPDTEDSAACAKAVRLRNSLKVELVKKFTIPLLCLFMAFCAVVLGTVLGTTGRARIPLLLLVNSMLFVMCWALLVWGEKYGDAGTLPPTLAMFLPNLTLAILGTALLGRARAMLSPDTDRGQP